MLQPKTMFQRPVKPLTSPERHMFIRKVLVNIGFYRWSKGNKFMAFQELNPLGAEQKQMYGGEILKFRHSSINQFQESDWKSNGAQQYLITSHVRSGLVSAGYTPGWHSTGFGLKGADRICHGGINVTNNGKDGWRRQGGRRSGASKLRLAFSALNRKRMKGSLMGGWRQSVHLTNNPDSWPGNAVNVPNQLVPIEDDPVSQQFGHKNNNFEYPGEPKWRMSIATCIVKHFGVVILAGWYIEKWQGSSTDALVWSLVNEIISNLIT